jgi:hypothetical protein
MSNPYSIRLDENQIEALKEAARRERRSLTQQVSLILAQWVEQNAPKQQGRAA